MTENSEKGLETLQVWQRALAYAKSVYQKVLPLLPVEERWNLASQIRRAAQSVPANIAEGYGRYYYQEGIRFCYIARGSVEETYSHLSLACQLGYIPESLFKEFVTETQELRRLINGYVLYLKKSKRGANEPGSQASIHEPDALYEVDSFDADLGFLPPDDEPPNH